MNTAVQGQLKRNTTWKKGDLNTTMEVSNSMLQLQACTADLHLEYPEKLLKDIASNKQSII